MIVDLYGHLELRDETGEVLSTGSNDPLLLVQVLHFQPYGEIISSYDPATKQLIPLCKVKRMRAPGEDYHSMTTPEILEEMKAGTKLPPVLFDHQFTVVADISGSEALNKSSLEQVPYGTDLYGFDPASNELYVLLWKDFEPFQMDIDELYLNIELEYNLPLPAEVSYRNSAGAVIADSTTVLEATIRTNLTSVLVANDYLWLYVNGNRESVVGRKA
jgi:hypothetical protein